LAIWGGATAFLRVRGQHLLHPGDWKGTLILFAVSFPLMAWIVRRLCRRFQLPPEQWLSGGRSVALPTLPLDHFSSVFFPFVFPNMAPEVAGVFAVGCCGVAQALSSESLFADEAPVRTLHLLAAVDQCENRSTVVCGRPLY
jgi:hypothetical protein